MAPFSLFTGGLLGVPSSSAGSSTNTSQSHVRQLTDGITRLRFALETMPSSRGFTFTPATREEVLAELYEAFWGQYAHLFVPALNPTGTSSSNPVFSNSNLGLGLGSSARQQWVMGVQMPMRHLLSEVQSRHGFFGAGQDEASQPGRPCGHIFLKGESCYRCKDCAHDDSSVLCSRCFHATDHSGHNVTFFIMQQSGGCCDCGDFESWRKDIGCRFHPTAPPEPQEPTDMQSVDATLEQSTPKAVARNIPMTGPSGANPSPSSTAAGKAPQSPGHPHGGNVPQALWESMTRTVAYALDFVLTTLDTAPDEPSVPAAGTLPSLRSSSPSPLSKDIYTLLIWNDEKHSFDEVAALLIERLGRSRDEAWRITRIIDEEGREVVDVAEGLEGGKRLLEVASAIASIDLGVSVRTAYDTFREQVSAVIIEWLLDLTRCRLQGDTMILRDVIARELLNPRRKEPSGIFSPGRSDEDPAFSVAGQDMSDPARLDWMFLYHTRLWKKPRLSLKEIYVSILALGNDHKLAITVHFANVYHRIIDSYLLVDREAETSIKYFALQLFTVPSLASHIVQHHSIISRLLAIITAFFTNQLSPDQKRILFPPDPTQHIDVDAFPFKSKRFMPVFSDLRYICNNESVKELIATNEEFIRQFCGVCKLFMCVNPAKRVVNTHVEYETDAWISVFNVTLSLSRVIRVYGEAFGDGRANSTQLLRAMRGVMEGIIEVCCTMTDGRLDKKKFGPVEHHDVGFGGRTYSVVKYNVLEGWVSFHHSLHWLLAELFKHTDLLDDEKIQESGLANIRAFVRTVADERTVLTVLDYPLRVLAMIAQIRTGLWVRNGFIIRGQLLHYRDFMLRELCYDQDLFMVQTGLIILENPDVVLISILDRFQLLQFFQGELTHPEYEGPHLTSMVEEVLYVLITILSETASASKMPLEKAVRREIIHALAVGPCPYTDLVKRVAERMVDDVCFDHVLREVAHFRAPEATADTGIYELRDEAYDEVDPWFFHYSRNRREEVEGVLKARLKRKTGVEDPVVVPKKMGVDKGPYYRLREVWGSTVLLQIMFFAVENVLRYMEGDDSGSPPSTEVIMDGSLHLVMLALVDVEGAFTSLALSNAFGDGHRSLVDVLCIVENTEKMKSYKPRVKWILDAMQKHMPEEVRRCRKIDDPATNQESKEDARKRAARARKEAIMRQMKAQQSSFAMNLDLEDDIMTDDEDKESELLDTPQAPVSFGTCIVCQEELLAGTGFGTLGLVQPSRFIRRHPDGSNGFLNEALTVPPSLDRAPVDKESKEAKFPPKDAEAKDKARMSSAAPLEGFPSQHTRFGLHASICSHMMHLDCFQVYNGSIKQRHRTQGQRNHPESMGRKEFICPLCKSLGNVILPVIVPSKVELSKTPFSDWIRSAGIMILKSKPDQLLDSLQMKTGTGEFVFWAAQDSGYVPYQRSIDHGDSSSSSEQKDWHKMLDTLMVVTKWFSQQTRHLRDRQEPDPGERGSGLYLPDDLVGYTLGVLEIGLRGAGSPGTLVADKVSDSSLRMIRGLVACLTRLAALHFRGRPDEGRDGIRQAIIKRLLPEWSRTSLTSLSYPLLLRDPLTILVETAAVAPEMLRHVLVLLYHACLARTVIGLVYVLNKARTSHTITLARRSHPEIFGDVRMFCMSVVRHSPVFEHTADVVFESFGEARVEKLLYAFTLPFLRRAAILCRAVLPSAFPTPDFGATDPCEYSRLLKFLGIPLLSDLPKQDTLQNALAGWCAHYGHSHAASQLNCGVALDYPSIFKIAKLPLVLDTLFAEEDKMICQRCKTVPTDPAICITCGTIVCVQSHCCRDSDGKDRGECNMHTRECGGAIGMFFLVKRCTLLYLFAGNGAFISPPYLDVHGEVDISMRRGRRQYLHHARWEEVRKTWMNHGIPTLVSRKLESAVDSGGWETL